MYESLALLNVKKPFILTVNTISIVRYVLNNK